MSERNQGDESPAPLKHYVSSAPFDPLSTAVLTPEQERFFMASQWQMMWWKLRRHRITVVAGVFLLPPENLYDSHAGDIFLPVGIQSRQCGARGAHGAAGFVSEIERYYDD